MTDAYDSDDDQDQNEPSPRDLRHQLAERAREADELRAQLEKVTRDAEFTKALGNDSAAPWVKYFQAGYDGPTEAEAIRKAAAEAGFLQAPAQQPAAAPASPGLQSAYDRIAAASGGGGQPGKETWEDALAEAGRIPNEADRTEAILDVVERFGGQTARQAQ